MKKFLFLVITILCFCGAIFCAACEPITNNEGTGEGMIQDPLPQPSENTPSQDQSAPEGTVPPQGEGQGQEKAPEEEQPSKEEPPKEQECAHDFSSWEEVLPTCTAEGERKRKCILCGKEEREPLPALGHNFSGPAPETKQEPTCTKEGVQIFHCQNEGCDETKEVVLQPNGHSFSVSEVIKEPTCTEEGECERVCTVCGYAEKTGIEALGHDLPEEFSVTKQPTCEEKGERTRKCTRCGYFVAEEIPANGHTFETKRKEPTCTEDGEEEKECSVCGKSQSTVLPALGHSYGEERVTLEPTCIDAGEKVKECSRCGDIQTISVPARGHDFSDEFTIDEVPTKDKQGSKSKHCLRAGCDARMAEEMLDMNSTLPYSVKVMRTNGAPVEDLKSMPRIFILDGTRSLKGGTGSFISADLPIGEYTAKIEYLPEGFTVDSNKITLTPNERECIFYLKRSITKPSSGNYTYSSVGSVLRDHSIFIVGSTPQENRTVTISSLLEEYKAIFINCYFTSCNPCMGEINDMVNAYYETDSLGNKYGDDVAMIMLPIGETEYTVRQFKNNPQIYTYTTEKTLPFMMALQNDLLSYITSDSYPTSYVIDCEGVVTFKHVSGLSKEGFTSAMEEHGLKYYKNLHPEEENGGANYFSVPEVVLPSKFKDEV